MQNGVKMMRPVLTREEYLSRRNTDWQRQTLKTAREQDATKKHLLVQMNYSCLPNPDGTLKGSKTASKSVGMDIDFKAPKELSAEEQQTWLAEQMAGVPELVMSKRDELGLLMLERSATKGYHLVFRRREDLSQEDNLLWASQLLGVKYDDKAKDITRVFFTTTGDADELLFLDDEIFNSQPASDPLPASPRGGDVAALTDVDPAGARHSPSKLGSALAVAALRCCSSKSDGLKVKF